MYDIFFFGTDSKSWNLLKSRFTIAKKADNLQQAKKRAFTKFFWAIFDDFEIDENFDFNYEPDIESQDIIHVFKNGNSFDGVALIPKNSLPTEKEFTYRFYAQKKEVNIQASTPKPFDRFYIDTYEEYLDALEKTTTEFLWIIPSNVQINPNFDFSYQPPTWEKYPHVLLNGKFYDGISLHNKNNPVTKKEFTYRFYAQKKEVNIQASTPKPFDIVFMSYDEPNAKANIEKLKKSYPHVKRVHGVKGIHNAHIEAARQVDTEMFWVVDADAEIVDSFNFDYQVPRWDQDAVHVWRSRNPINDLVYGYGGVKLLPTSLTLNMDFNKPDMTTSISTKFNAVEEISNITSFNTDAFSAWKSAFRECAKLSSRIIDNQDDLETMERLAIWCNVGTNELYGVDAIRGAKEGKKFGEENKHNLEELKKINDFDWLEERFYDKH